MSKTLVLIPSRLSATRLPNKPLLKINGVALINHVYKKAMSTGIGKVYVVTGDKTIFKEVVKNGGKSILTHKNHASGTDRIYEGLENLRKFKYEYVLNLQGDEPLINVNDIINLNNRAIAKKIEFATLACKINNAKIFSKKNIVKVLTKNHISLNNLSRAISFSRNPKKINHTKTYQHIGIYIYKTSVLKKITSFKATYNERTLKLEQLRALENNIPIHVLLARKKPIGVDTFEDFEKVKNILET